jgi:hippurate hydrolase
VAVFKNGPGPVVLIRTDMDALPIVEQTGLAYASKVRTKDLAGNDVGVMHACGHDIHMASWVGSAGVLASTTDNWSGTVVFIAQPAEEVIAGARMMLDDGLYKRFPKPDYALALHSDPQLPVGAVSFVEGLTLAASDTIDITVKGKGGHGAAPQATVDPIVLAARGQSAGSVRGHGWVHPRRNEAQHHPQRSEAATDCANHQDGDTGPCAQGH